MFRAVYMAEIWEKHAFVLAWNLCVLALMCLHFYGFRVEMFTLKHQRL